MHFQRKVGAVNEDPSVPLTSMTGFLLQRSGAMLLAQTEQAMEARGTRVRYGYVLAALNDTPDMSQHDLAQTIGLDAGILGSLVDEMESAGHVARKRSPTDKRRYVIRITDDGRELLQVLLGDMREIERQFLRELTDEEAVNLRIYLDKVLGDRWPDAIRCNVTED